MEKKLKVGIWIRVSTEDQAKGESPLHHEERARAYAKMNEWEIITVYHLEGVSGKSVEEHPETIRMLQDVKSGNITGLIFSKVARLARSTKQLLEFSEYFREYNADLISLQEKIDTSTPAGRLFYTVIAAMAQWEREEIVERITASIPVRAKMGKSIGGSAPYGYQWKDGKLALDKEEAVIRAKMFEYFLDVKRKGTVARMLNEQGYRTRDGFLFSLQGVGRLLSDPIAKGLRRGNYTKSIDGGRTYRLKDKELWIFSEAPAIVSEEVWQKCNDIMDDIRRNNKRTPKIAFHLFGGLTYCHCGGKMYVKTNNPKYCCMKCSNKIPVEDLEEAFYSELKTFIFSETEINSYTSEIKQEIEKRKQIKSSLINEIANLKQKLQNLLDLHDRKELPTDGFKSHYNPIYEQLNQKETYFNQLEGELDSLIIQSESTEVAFKDAQDINNQWHNTSREEKVKIIHGMTERIIIGKEDIEIVIKGISKSPSLKSMAKGLHNLICLLWI